ncbi:hypothetical protein [Kineosporia sp. R_H_3]|uniref:hypothetical protein n=1 Tax=Kineosporia sp. R_H_3 TaxID=1961848 RepID=UPI00130428B7|nr:hypothetical protein [Kineosporia sp. R_H_3]
MRGARRRTTVTLAVAACVGLVACSGATSGGAPTSPTAPASSGPATTTTAADTPTPTATPSTTPTGAVSNSATSTKNAAAEAALADGRHAVVVTEVDAGARLVTVDVVQFLTGDAAAKAAKEDGGESPPPNDYWIRNANPKLRTLVVLAGAPITVNTLAAEETGSSTQDVRKSLTQLAAYGDVSGRLFQVTVRGGKVIALAEQYLP